MSHTVTPQVNSEGQVVDFTVESPHEGYWKGSESDFVEHQDGSVHHLFEDVQIDESTDPEEEYVSALHELYPDLADAIIWAETEMSHEFIDGYNTAVDNDDLGRLYGYIEQLLELYNAPSDEDEGSSNESYEEELGLDVSDEQISDEVTSLIDAEPQGEEFAYQYEEAATAWLANGYEVEAAILEMTNQFHRGVIDAETAISQVINAYGDASVIKAYMNLSK
jgi:hypothetical protein